MKNYKFLVPIALIGLYVLSIYMLYNSKKETEEKYNNYINAAREYKENDITKRAEENYMAALGVKPTLELYIEIGDFYKETEQEKKAEKWGNVIIDEYPKEAASYEFMMNIYMDKKDYISCFNIYDTLKNRKLSSEYIEEAINEIGYEFYYVGEYEDVGIYSGGYCPVRIKEKWGYVNEKGSMVIAAKYIKAGGFFNNLAPVADEKEAYFIDAEGYKQITFKEIKNIDNLGVISGDIFPLCISGKWSIFDIKGNRRFGEYDNVSVMSGGVIAALEEDKWSILDSEGKKITEETYDDIKIDEISVACRNDRLFVSKDYNYYLMDSNGKIITEQSYEDADVFKDDTYAAVKIDGKWGFIDKNGEVKIEPQYEEARSFKNGFAAVKDMGKWGFIDLENNKIIDTQFDDAKDFSGSGSVYVYQYDTWKLLMLYRYNH